MYAKGLLSVFLGLLFALLFAPTGHSQENALFQLNNTNDGEQQLEDLLECLRANASFRLNGRVLEIERACDIDDKQRTQLRVAAKGALKNFVNEERKDKERTLKQYQRQIGIDPDNEDEDQEVTGSTAFIMNVKDSRLVEQEKRWNKSLKQILSDEQHEKLKKAKQKQREFLASAAVERYVAQLELKLFLDAGQRDQIRDVIQENFAEYLVNGLSRDGNENNNVFMIPGQVQEPEPEHVDLVKDILSEDQLAAWIRLIEPELNKIKQLPDW